jgi:hypothetical protein
MYCEIFYDSCASSLVIVPLALGSMNYGLIEFAYSTLEQHPISFLFTFLVSEGAILGKSGLSR